MPRKNRSLPGPSGLPPPPPWEGEGGERGTLLLMPGSPQIQEEMLQAGEMNKSGQIKGWVGGMRMKSAFAQAVAIATADTQ